MKKTPGVDMTSGSLGIGLSVGSGMALGAKITQQSFRVYVLIGDGETNEGQIWEAAMTAAHYHLDNLIAFVDLNRFQNDGTTAETMRMDPLAEKWRAFRWNVLEVNGHDFRQLLAAIEEAQSEVQSPSVILCNTVKGKGVSFMENQIKFHGFSLNEEQFQQALHELS
jgi:transketolase